MIVQKIKILQLIHSIQLGGAEIVAFNISETCKEKNPYEFDFVITELYASKDKYAREKRNELTLKNIRIHTLYKGSQKLSLLFAPFHLFFLILKEKPQIIHSHTDLPDFVLAVAIKVMNLFRFKYGKIVRTIHNTALWPTHSKIGKFTESSFKNDFIIGVSEASLQAYKQQRQKYHLPESPQAHVIYNGCLNPRKEQLPFTLNKSKINIAFCGRFEYQKGVDILADRIREINRTYNDQCNFILIGDGTFMPQIQKLVDESENVCHFLPIINISNKLHHFDFVIMPSRFEGLVLLSLEASFAGVPVIAAKAPGLTETLPTDWPLFFDLENSDSLMKIIQNIMTHKYDINELKKQAEKFVIDKFTIKKMTEAYSQLYSSIC